MKLFKWLQCPRKTCTAVLVAAGNATRMNGIDKVMAPVGGKPLLFYALRAFNDHPLISQIVVVTRPDLLVPVTELCRDCGFSKVRRIVPGGDTRTQSVLCGVRACKGARYIAVHDAARPLVSETVISDAVKEAFRCGAAAPAIPVKDTVKLAENGFVTETPPREKLFAVQTPQVFDADLLKAALMNAQKNNLPVTDDCSAAEKIGMRVRLTAGEERNFKITTSSDLIRLRAYLEG